VGAAVCVDVRGEYVTYEVHSEEDGVCDYDIPSAGQLQRADFSVLLERQAFAARLYSSHTLVVLCPLALKHKVIH
jgi:hypothetical protein